MSENVVVLERKLRRSRVFNLVLGAGLVVALIALFAPGVGSSPQSATPELTQASPEAPTISTAPTMTIGSPDAPVTLMEWTDFTCPYCALFHRETLPAIVAQYVDEGLVRLEIHDVTFIGPQAEDAAVAARAAGEQGRYLDYVYGVYALSKDGNKPDLSPEVLTGVADTLDLDLDRFAADAASSDLRGAVQMSSAQAKQLGISSVPFFVAAPGGRIDGTQEIIQGAQPLENFQLVLDTVLERAGH